MRYPCLSNLHESRLALRIKHSYEEASPVVSYKLRDKNAIGRQGWNITTQERRICDVEIEIISIVVNGSVKLTTLPNRQ